MRIATPLLALIFAILLQPMTAAAQEQQYWLQRIAASYVSYPTMVKDAAGNVYIEALNTYASPANSFMLVKYSSGGTQLWTAAYSNGNVVGVIGIGVDNSQNLYVGINTTTGIAVMKYSSAGQLLWLNPVTYNNGQPLGTAMTVDTAGNSYITGATVTLSHQTLTFKINSSGIQQWAVSYVGTAAGEESGAAITVDGPGNVYVAANSEGQETLWLYFNGVFNKITIPTYFDIVTIKYSPSGTMLWNSRYTGAQTSSQDLAAGITVDSSSGNVYTVGKSMVGTASIGDVIANSPTGTQLWANQDNNTISNLQVMVDPSGNTITLGNAPGWVSFTATKYSPAGSILWTTSYSPSQGTVITDFAGALDHDGNLYVTIPVGVDNIDYCTLQYYSDGTLAWALTYNGPANGQDNPYAICIQNPVRRGVDLIQYPDIFVTGTGDNFTDLTTIMYSRPPVVGRSIAADSVTGQAATLGTTPFAQLSNYPNPFRGATTITYTIANNSHVILQVYDGAGRPVATLVNQQQTAGTYTLPFETGHLAAGIYQYRIIAQSPQVAFTQTKQMIVQ